MVREYENGYVEVDLDHPPSKGDGGREAIPYRFKADGGPKRASTTVMRHQVVLLDAVTALSLIDLDA